jgi:hypothetical protein
VEGAEDELGDPLTFYLRHFGPDAEGRTMAPMAPLEPTAEPNEIEVLVRQGESRAVLSKKILLCVLAAREAARSGSQPGEPDVQAASDAFRRRFGLEDAEEMSAWLMETGLELADYSRAMYGFAAISSMQARWSREVESLFDTFLRIASIRSRDQ